MTELQEAILRNTKIIVFNTNVDRKRRKWHNHVQKDLIIFFREMGFYCIPEYKIEYRTLGRITRLRDFEDLSRRGRIDIYAQRDNLKIAIEFDSGASMKYKSIEKLLQSNANICAAFAFGPKNTSMEKSEFYLSKNIRHVNQVYDELCSFYSKTNDSLAIQKLVQKEFWLGIIKTNIFKHITYIHTNQMMNIHRNKD